MYTVYIDVANILVSIKAYTCTHNPPPTPAEYVCCIYVYYLYTTYICMYYIDTDTQ